MADRHARSGTRSPGVPTRRDPPPAIWREAARALLRTRAGATQGRRGRRNDPPFPGYYEQATCVSFAMDGVPVSAGEYATALARGAAARARRTRAALRVRNHVAVLRRIEWLLRRGQPLLGGDVIRWYTSIASGLSAGGVGAATLARIDRVVSSVNSPRLRFWPAVQEVAALHVDLLADPFVPGFNGILARLLLRYHMGRCGLPAIVFDPVDDPPRLTSVTTLEPRLLELIVKCYDGGTSRGARE